jgi:hypothetical protein
MFCLDFVHFVWTYDYVTKTWIASYSLVLDIVCDLFGFGLCFRVDTYSFSNTYRHDYATCCYVTDTVTSRTSESELRALGAPDSTLDFIPPLRLCNSDLRGPVVSAHHSHQKVTGSNPAVTGLSDFGLRLGLCGLAFFCVPDFLLTCFILCPFPFPFMSTLHS